LVLSAGKAGDYSPVPLDVDGGVLTMILKQLSTDYSVATARSVADLIERKLLAAHFQPIANLQDGSVYAHEALIRGPSQSPLAMPDQLFQAARRDGCVYELEVECVRCALSDWLANGQKGRLFINISADSLVRVIDDQSIDIALSNAKAKGISLASLVIELTEHEIVRDPEALQLACMVLQRHGISIALDDFGDGRSSLRSWSELKPEIVKIDRYFLKDLAGKADKVQTLRALLQIAETFGSKLVAEGLETLQDLRLARDLGIAYGQGWVLGKPAAQPLMELPAEVAAVLRSADIAVMPERARASNSGYTVARLLTPAIAVEPVTTHERIYSLFQDDDSLHAVAIADKDRPFGLIGRSTFIAAYARRYFKELYGDKPCTLFANLSPLIVDIDTSIEDLTKVLTSSDQRYLTEGFIITEGGLYRGLGTGQQLVRAVTEARIEAARHANPLTFLPGNIPISDHIDRLLASGSEYAACYADLNHFKPFNDQYGYWRGDEMIRLLARVLMAHCDPQRDFLGHVGGDDFVILFQSSDWYERCEHAVTSFNEKALELFDAKALEAGGIHAEDRHGDRRFYPCTTLSVGVVRVHPGQFRRSEDVASAAAAAKRQAKHDGHSVFVLDSNEVPGTRASEL
jgi:diguanylate cyclase (GGDEF)-like protein